MNDIDDGVSTLRVVSARDPAIDAQRTDRARYARTRDASLLQFLPGHRPRWFVLRALTVNDMLGVESAPSAQTKFIRALMYGLEAVEGHIDDGSALRPSRTIPMPGGGERTIWGDDDLERLFRAYGMTVVYEIGALVYERAFRGNAWSGGADSYTVLPVLLEDLERIERQRVE